MKFKKTHWIGIGLGLFVLIVDIILFRNDELFFFLMGISLGVIVLPFIVDVITKGTKEDETSRMFLEFSRNLAASVTTGTPISKSIVNVSNKDYGVLTPYIKKLANQISLGIPLSEAMQTFADEVNSKVIQRAVGLIMEAERAGGEIDFILESVAKSISEVEKLKKERRAAIYNLAVQGYIIFFIFIGITLVMEFKILPLTSGIGSIGGFGGFSSGITAAPEQAAIFTVDQLTRPFLFLLLTQGLFTGLTIGKIGEGSLKAGIKHSFVLGCFANIYWI
jgi:flagellar protein FlaJ